MAFSKLRKLIKKTISLDPNQLISELVSRKDIQKLIITLNTQDQLFKRGEDSLGKKLKSDFAIGGQVYATRTIIIKEEKGQPTDRVTLKDTGEFYDSFRIIVAKDRFFIVADPLKDGQSLFDDWGEEIIGLNEANTQKLIDALRVLMPGLIRKKICN